MSDITKGELPDWPPYTHVPGVTPHPISASTGHMRNDENGIIEWRPGSRLKWGLMLFNRGYYWEAHEAWEHLWIELGRISGDALIVKGLIKLAACGVKCIEGNRNGAIRHAARAAVLLGTDPASDQFFGVNLKHAREVAVAVQESPPISATQSDGTPLVLNGFLL